MFWTQSTSWGAAWHNLHFSACRGSCIGERIQSQIGADLEMLLGLGRPWVASVESAQLPAGFILLSSLVLAGPCISERQEFAILFLVCLYESTTTRNPAAQGFLCELNSIAAGTTIKRELVKLPLLVSFKRLIKGRLLVKLQMPVMCLFTHSLSQCQNH